MTTKHEQILAYIEQLEIGHKISVRQIAKTLGVSDGTAYRAIKDAETRGIVNTIERVGTVRIEKKQRSEIEKITFAEVVNIVDGTVLGGKEGLHKTLTKFVIGAMKLEALLRYVGPGNLLIVGNRDRVHQVSLEYGAAVLITGGFDATEEVKQMADFYQLPVISSSYDTFTVASLINRAIYDRLIKKEILLVEDLLATHGQPITLEPMDSVDKFHQLVRETSHSKFPVVEETGRIVGMVTAKDVIGLSASDRIEKAMTRSPVYVHPHTSLAAAAHEMVWEGIELLPVVDEQKRLLGIVSRQDVIESLQTMQKQPQVGETVHELSTRGFQEVLKEGTPVLRGKISPQMTDSLGILSTGVLTTLMTETCLRLLRKYHREDLVIQNFTLYTLKPVQLETMIEIVPKILELGRNQAKLDVEVLTDQQVVGKALITAQMIEK
ncbi:putative transcriptional regulator [Croceifilum oryzae]|uniref:Transcriptional regulator n=1 Tax=Croceifilum oryzae TaxID=1553429 RepID=A0AAJ1TDB9_9BACL|nr:DRTGG domain-containing protein [Croceifilum oryzae]MDQ0416733.1 putative transcriptional regulator [Croceifilum oryzae]